MLIELRRTLSVPLTLLYRRSLDTGVLPVIWKQAQVVPIHKKGSKQDPGNYRPVSLTSVLCKVLEALIRDEVLQHLITYGLLSEDQHGFRPGRSCSTQLLATMDDWSRWLEDSTPLDVIYLDFRKAFDSVPHMRLLCKLKSYGISGKLYSWIESFLSERCQQVSIGGCCSSMVPVTSGVPQGSVLGPLLFLLYVNDLPEAVNCPVKLFADDTKLYSGIASESDALRMQADLDSLVQWSDSWQMPFNEDKCKVMHVGSANKAFSFHMKGDQLVRLPAEVSSASGGGDSQGNSGTGSHPSVLHADKRRYAASSVQILSTSTSRIWQSSVGPVQQGGPESCRKGPETCYSPSCQHQTQRLSVEVACPKTAVVILPAKTWRHDLRVSVAAWRGGCRGGRDTDPAHG